MVDSSALSGFDPVATARWVKRLARFAAGTHTVVGFCAAEGVSASNFYLWRRRLAPAAPPPAARVPAVVPLRVVPPLTPPTPIELVLPSGAALRFPPDARPELVVAVVRGVEGRPC
ncbi:MAG TPA: hypothetical protein VD866_25105 [Urbifossiella sp.]|nr:hypothetical protein [Urbifossiella sp.]